MTTDTTARKGPPIDLSPTNLLTIFFFLFVLVAMLAWAYFDAPNADTF